MTVTVAPPSLSGSATSTTERTARRQLMSTPIAAGGASLHDTSSSRSSLSTVADSSDDAYSLRMLPVSSRNASASSVGIASLPATSNIGRNIAPVNAHFRDPTLSTLQQRPVNTIAGQGPPLRGQGSMAGGRGLLQGGRGSR